MAWCLDDVVIYFGTHVENELMKAGITDQKQASETEELNERRRRVLHEILYGNAGSRVGPVLINKVDVPGRTRPPQADDPEDPFGLHDKSDPKPSQSGRYKDPRTLFDQLEGK